MKKLSIVLVAAVSLVLFASCMTGPNGERVPDWVLNPPVVSDFYYGVGYADQANLTLSKRVAETRGRADIASQIEVTIQEVVSIYTQESGTGDESQLIEFVEVATRQITDQTVAGAVVHSMHLMDDGGVWVLIAYDIEAAKHFVAEAIEAAAREFARTEEAAFSEWKAGQAFAYMDQLLDTNPPRSKPVTR